jgi:hypothetical protein
MKQHYRLTGKIGYWHEHYQNGPRFRGREFDENITAKSDKEAIEKAKEAARSFYKRYEHLAPSSEIPKSNSLDTGCFSVRLTKVFTETIWATGFIPGDSPEPAVPAKPAVIIPEVPAKLEKPGKSGYYSDDSIIK